MGEFGQKTLEQIATEASREKNTMGLLETQAGEENKQRKYAEKEVELMREKAEKERIINEIVEKFYRGHEDEALALYKKINSLYDKLGAKTPYTFELSPGSVIVDSGEFRPLESLGEVSVEDFKKALKALEEGKAILTADDHHRRSSRNSSELILIRSLDVWFKDEMAGDVSLLHGEKDPESLYPEDLDGPEGPERG